MNSKKTASLNAPCYQRLPFYRCLTGLDYFLLLVVAGTVMWFYYRLSIGVNYYWRWSEAIELIITPRADGSLPYFFQGIISTVRLSIWGMLFALVWGVLLGLARASRWAIFRMPAIAYIQLIRNIPPLVFVFIFYFFISNQLIPLLGLTAVLREHSGDINPLQAVLFGPANLWENVLSGVLCVGMLSAAYIGEIVRSGLENIPKGQWEAAKSLGLSPSITLIKVIAPQVMTMIAPMLAGQSISLVKDSSIVSLISIQELTFVGSEMANSSGLIFEIWLMVGGIYLLLCLTLTLLFSAIERRGRVHLKK